MGKNPEQTVLPRSSLQWQPLPQFPHSRGGLEGGFGRAWLILCCVCGEKVILYFYISQVSGRLGEGPTTSSSNQRAVLIHLTSFHDPHETASHYGLPCILTLQTGNLPSCFVIDIHIYIIYIYIHICIHVCILWRLLGQSLSWHKSVQVQ